MTSLAIVLGSFVLIAFGMMGTTLSIEFVRAWKDHFYRKR